MSRRSRQPDLTRLEEVLGDVVLEAEIARTSRSRVYRVCSAERGDRPLALKVAAEPGNPEELARFAHEVRLLSEVRHRNVVEVYDFGILPGGFPFLTMELLVTGEPSRALAAAEAEGDWDGFWSLALDAAAGLAHIHRHGLLHLDVKPANLGWVVEEGGEPGGEAIGEPWLKILDFGLAQVQSRLMDRRIRGTLAYTAPEILLQDDYDQRADLYSLGMTLFELATGVLPSAGDAAAAVRYHLEGGPADPRRYRPDMPEPLARMLTRLLERDPGRRPASAAQLLSELGQACGRAVDAAELLGVGRVLASRMVGRDDALGRLREHLAADSGKGRIVIVEGEEGVGKSRLLRELRLFAALEGARVGWGRSPGPRAEPLQPLLHALARVGLDLTSTLEAPPAVTSEGDPVGGRRRLLQRILAHLAGLRSFGGSRAAHSESPRVEGPWVLLLEDLHLADRETHEILALLAGDVAALPVLVVATRRPPPASERDRLGEADGVERLALPPLGAGEVALLVDACLGSAELPEIFYQGIYERTGGSPLAVQQLLRHLVEEGVLEWKQGRWGVAPAALERLPEAPGGAEELGWRRLSHLEEGPRRILEAAAVIAEPFSLEEMAALLGEEPEVVYEAVIGLHSQACLDRLEEEGATLYVFSQRRLREALYAGLDRVRRCDLHRRFAEVLAQRPDTAAARAAAVADHLWRAGERAASFPHLVTAAERAAAVYGHREAAALYGRAADAAEAAGEVGAVPGLRLTQVEALTAAAGYAEALAVVEELLGSPPEGLGDPLLGARAWLARGRLHGRLGEHEPALESYRTGLGRLAAVAEAPADAPADAPPSGLAVELRVDLLHGEAMALKDLGRADAAFSTARSALRQAGRHGLHRQRAGLLSILATIFYGRGDWPRARRLLSRGLRAARQAGAGALAARLRNNLGNVLWKTGELDQAQQIYRDNLAECERTHDLWGQLAALHNLGILEASRGSWRRARKFLTRSLAVKRRIGAWETEALGHLNLAEAEEVLGNWDEARRHCERGLELLEDTPEHPDRWGLTAQLASLERKRGNLAAAGRLAEQALEAARRLEDPDLTARCHGLLARVERDRGQPDLAAAHLERAFAALGSAETPESLAALHLERADLALCKPAPGSLAQAAADARAARERIESLSDRLADGRLRVVEARLAAAEGRQRDAETLFAGASELLDDLGARFDLAQGLVEWGIAAREPEAARGHLERALELFRQLGAEAAIRRARGALESLRSGDRRALTRSASAHTDPADSENGSPAVLYEVSKIINSTLDLDEVLDRTLDLVLERLGAERGMIVLRDSLTRELDVAVSRNLGSRGDEGRLLSESVVRRVLDTEQPVLAVDALSDHRFQAAESIVASHILSVLCVPLTIRERVAGAIYVDHGRSRDLFGERERELLVAFADQAAIAIENARLYGELDEARQRLKAENESLRREILASHHLGSFIGKSPAIAELKGTLERVARSHSTVLIRGESGTGKGLVGRIIHAISPRREGPFIHFNCAALPESLAESELFGHEKGAFTGAAGRKPGRFELAQEGTIFLDEIGKLARSIQAKLLRVVEEKVFERVGGTRTLEADVRIIAATNLNLEQAIERGEFREDLYYRLNIIPIVLPPLRERRDDIPYLAQHFLTRISQDLGREGRTLDPAVLDLFAAHSWPGNVRELEAAIHRALVLSPRDVLTPADFGWIGLGVREGAAVRGSRVPLPAPETAAGRRGERLTNGGYQDALARHDRRLIEEALAHCDGSLREAARLLGISRNTLKARMGRYGLRGKSEGSGKLG